MKNSAWRSCLVAGLLSIPLLTAAQEAKLVRGHLSLPSKDWGVALDLPGFIVKTVETKPDGRRYMVAENDYTKVVVSLTLEQVKPGAPGNSCRESLEAKSKSSPFKVQDVEFSHSGEFDLMQYFVPEFRGRQVNQKNIFACQLHDNTYIDLHVSKINYGTADESLLMGVVSSMHIDRLQ